MYTLWSHGRLLGYTDLDIPCVQSHLRQGFIEPTDEGRRILPDAAGVPAACAATRRGRRDGAMSDASARAHFRTACDRRDALDLELRDGEGQIFACDFIRIHDLHDDALYDHDDDFDQEFDDLEASTAVEHDAVSLLDEDRQDAAWFPEDERWETMQYHMIVYLKASNGSALESATALSPRSV